MVEWFGAREAQAHLTTIGVHSNVYGVEHLERAKPENLPRFVHYANADFPYDQG
jgi:hypothetical protein